jgi:dihydrofolate reductase
MADLTYTAIASLDGYIADERGTFDWARPSEEVHQVFNDLQRADSVSLLGRRMYETMRVWDTFSLDDLDPTEREFAEVWRNTDKVVYSSTLSSVPEPRTRLESTFDPDAVRALKASTDGGISVGGATLAGEAFRAGLVDRCLLVLVPTIVGGGTRALPALPDAARVDLVLQEERRFADGAVLLDYRIA